MICSIQTHPLLQNLFTVKIRKARYPSQILSIALYHRILKRHNPSVGLTT
uniref:Mitochondrial malate dehydrogenase n=1 Tax=Cotylophoron cotylophoron TaxID=1280158 RepID=A0A0K2YXY8_9TREM|nr:mitochondrial malate dehydrogenase [Cotylophoron cotylophorum]